MLPWCVVGTVVIKLLAQAPIGLLARAASSSTYRCATVVGVLLMVVLPSPVTISGIIRILLVLQYHHTTHHTHLCCPQTPTQHWDMLSRRWKQRKNVQAVSLFIVDELHLIGGAKGPCIEVVASRMRQISSHAASPIRMLGLSTSLANAKDLAQWLGASSQATFNFPPGVWRRKHVPIHVFCCVYFTPPCVCPTLPCNWPTPSPSLTPGVRPVPLEIHIQGFEIANFEARMQAMTRPSFAALNTYATDGKPALLFVPTRKHARLVALDVLTFAAAEGAPRKFLQVRGKKGECVMMCCCQTLLFCGHTLTTLLPHVAVHHHGHAIVSAHTLVVLFPTAPCVMSCARLAHAQIDESDMEAYLGRVKDPALKHTLQYGVGFLHETLTAEEQEVVTLLFGSGAIQVCVDRVDRVETTLKSY